MKLSTQELLAGLKAQDKRILGKAITLIESKNQNTELKLKNC